MPRMDGTGPRGKGPETGRGLGNCGPMNKGFCGRGQGMGMGRGLGLGLGRGMQRGLGRGPGKLR